MAAITPSQAQILIITTFLSITWGIYLAGSIREYMRMRATAVRRRTDMIVALRRVIVALCLWLFVFSFCFRIICVIVGVDDDVAAQIVFFSLLGSNVAGSIFAVVSLWYD